MNESVAVRVKEGYAYLYSQEAITVLENAEKSIQEAQTTIEKIYEDTKDFAQQVLERTQSDWLENDTENLGYIKNKPFILSNLFLPNALLEKKNSFEIYLNSSEVRVKQYAKIWFPEEINTFTSQIILEELILSSQSLEQGNYLIFLVKETSELIAVSMANCCVGTQNTLQGKGAFWNSSVGKIFLYDPENTTSEYTLSFPLAQASVSAEKLFITAHPFYHVGVMGSSCFVLPDLSLLISDGVDDKHNFCHKNVKITAPLVNYQALNYSDVYLSITKDLELQGINAQSFYEQEYFPDTPSEGDTVFLKDKNAFFIFQNSLWQERKSFFTIARVQQNLENLTLPSIMEKKVLNLDLEAFAQKDLSNIPSTYDYVVESWCDINNGNFYRKFKSGWIEQGGRATAGEADTVINLLIPFKNANYMITDSTENPADGGRVSIYWHTSTTFTCLSRERGGNTTSVFRWMACGF